MVTKLLIVIFYIEISDTIILRVNKFKDYHKYINFFDKIYNGCSLFDKIIDLSGFKYTYK